MVSPYLERAQERMKAQREGLWLNDNAIYEPQPLPVRYGRPRNTGRRMFIAFCIGSSIGIGILLAVLGILAS